ncbi:lipoyl synthase [Desulfogranum mediterraneum]|uniref:lipoyl synthase n=1 Tax=Desulfogranum mediterraneum TaxID=160661 RepID=UPI000415EC44|nr:lipoyl synthase [Desulfogranum mediterraneum]
MDTPPPPEKNHKPEAPARPRKPKWLKRRLPTGPTYERIRGLVKESQLATVCQEAMCPNQFECYGKGTATFMILGHACSRNCRFCAVSHGPSGPPDPEEPRRLAQAVASMGLHYAVITSVTRDDLADGGANHFARTIQAIRQHSPGVRIEVLIPDLQGDEQALETIVRAGPDVLNHNLETVARLYPLVRPQAIYRRSLELLARVKAMDPAMITKSGLMVGLGESAAELHQAFADLLAAHCDLLTLGQYLQPSKEHLEVVRYLPPEEFALLKARALELGFGGVAADPFVRSSYQAEELYSLARERASGSAQHR